MKSENRINPNGQGPKNLAKAHLSLEIIAGHLKEVEMGI
jgi:hypothetical protein